MKNIVFLFVLQFSANISLFAEVRILDSHIKNRSLFAGITGARTLYQAALDTNANTLIIEQYETNTKLNPKKLVSQKKYPLGSLEEVQMAQTEMRRVDLYWPLDSFYQLKSKDCKTIIFNIPTESIDKFAEKNMAVVSRLKAEQAEIGVHKMMSFASVCGMPMFHLGAVITLNGQLKSFALVSDDDNPLPFEIIEQNGIILIKNKNLTLVRISEQEKFDSSKGGRFTTSVITKCEGPEYKEFSLQIRPKEKDGLITWNISSQHELDGHIRLNRDQRPGDKNVGEDLIGAPVQLAKGVVDGIFGTLFWNIFVSDKGKIEVVENKIYEESKKNITLTTAFSDNELKDMARGIATSTKVPWYAPFWGTNNIKERAAMTFAFELIKKRALKQLPVGASKDMANGVAVRVTRDIEQCFRSSESSVDTEVCVAKFARTAPYRVGRELLDLHMSAALRPQDLFPQQKNGIIAKSLFRYDQCSKSNYFLPYDQHLRQIVTSKKKGIGSVIKQSVKKGLLDIELPFEPDKVIIGCLFEGSIAGADEALKIGSGKLLNSPQDKELTTAQFRQCLAKEKILTYAENFIEYNHQLLQNMEVDIFTKKLEGCITQGKIKAGELIIKDQISTQQALLKVTKGHPEIINEVVEKTIAQGLHRCLQSQGNDKRDPAKCTAIIENVASKEVFILLLKDSLSKEMGAGTKALDFALREVGLGDQESSTSSMDINKCFDNRREKLISLLQEGTVLPTDDFSNANCAIRTILELAPILVRNKYIKTLDEKKDLKNISGLRDEGLIRSMGEKMRTCLYEEMAGTQKMAIVGVKLESAQKKCTVELYKKTMPDVMEKALDEKLLKIVPNKDRRLALASRLKQSFSEKIKNLESEEEIKAALDDFEIVATIEVSKQSVIWAVEDNLPSKAEYQKEVAEKIINKVIVGKWENEMADAIKKKNEVAQVKLRSQLKKEVGPLIMKEVLPIKLAPYIQNLSVRLNITQTIVNDYNKCLLTIKDDSVDFDNLVKGCSSTASDRAAYAVFEHSLMSELENRFPILSGSEIEVASNKVAQNQVRSKILGKTLLLEMAEANRQGPKALAHLGDIFKIRAAREVAVILLERELYNALSGTVLSRVLPKAKVNVVNCFNNVEEKLQKKETVVTDVEIKKCIRKIKVDTGFMSLMESFKEKWGILKDQTERKREILESTANFYHSCTAGNQTWTDQELENTFKDCLSGTVLHFAEKLGQSSVDYFAPVRSGANLAFPAYLECLLKVKSNNSKNLTWVKDEIDKCVKDILRPKLSIEVGAFYNTKIRSDMNDGERKVAEEAFSILSPIFKGKLITTPHPKKRPESAVDSLKAILEKLAGFISPAAHFDQVITKKRIAEFNTHIASLINGESTITDKQFTEELIKSELMSTIIESFIVNKVASIGGNSWVNEQARKRLLSADTLRLFFEETASGKRLMEDIKKSIVRPILSGTHANDIIMGLAHDIPVIIEREMDEIKRILAF